jgi:hypothetical protein
MMRAATGLSNGQRIIPTERFSELSCAAKVAALGIRGMSAYVLCEINVSSVAPFSEQASEAIPAARNGSALSKVIGPLPSLRSSKTIRSRPARKHGWDCDLDHARCQRNLLSPIPDTGRCNVKSQCVGSKSARSSHLSTTAHTHGLTRSPRVFRYRPECRLTACFGWTFGRGNRQ